MEQRINVAELLKDCPNGMELNCTMYEDVYFDFVNEFNIIHCYVQCETHKTSITFNQYGAYNGNIKSKCVIFPKGKTTWEEFQRPFKDGDVVATNSGLWIGITLGGKEGAFIPTYCVIDSFNTFMAYLHKKENWKFNRLATEEEKAKLFKAIKDNGYRWNEESKTLEKLIEPKFKVGDTIKDKDGYKVRITEVNLEDEYYGYESMIAKGIGGVGFREQDNWELVPNKFDITTLKPFESKVLVRDVDYHEWEGAIFGRYDGKKFFTIGGLDWGCCIPYEENKHLLGKTDNCDNFYKTWEE